jgi:hypothetical protein
VWNLPDFSSIWFCPKDKAKLRERTIRNQGGKFPVNVSQPEGGINNALAVRKISAEQRTEAWELAQELTTHFPDKKVLTLVSTECPICGFRAIAPDLGTLGPLASSKAVRKGQLKTIQSITRQAENAAKKSGSSQTNRSSFRTIWLLFIFGGLFLSMLGVVIVYLQNFLP